MIRIVYDREEGKLWFNGHADYAEKGNDIVCAAISALHETLAMHECIYRGKNVRDSSSFLWIWPRMQEFVRPVMDAFAAGMEQIARQYPDHVNFERL